MCKWEKYTEKELESFILSSETYSEIGRKIGYKSFSKNTIQKILNKYPNLSYAVDFMLKKNDLTGKQFGRLKVLYFDEDYSKKKGENVRYWKCLCECGTEISVRTSSLKNGNTKSCGCLHKETSRNKTFIDMTGEKCGSLTVIKEGKRPENVNNTRAYWWCKCDCGNPNLILVEGQLLRNGHKTSCGCVVSQYEKQIQKILNENKIEYSQQYSFPDLISDNNRVLRFDFAIFNKGKLKYLLEFQGQQHYKSVPGWGGEEKFKQQKEYDKRKVEYCQLNNIPLVVISYKDKISYENVIYNDLLED